MDSNWSQNTPIYQQLKDRTIASILSGQLKEGDLLPSVRQVAIEFQINPLTVSKAYQMLVDEDLVHSERGVGMRIKSGAYQQLLEQERSQFLTHEWPEIIARMHRLNISIEDLIGSDDKKALNS